MAIQQTSRQRGRPATSPEEREKQLQNLAYDVAEEQLKNRTASSQIVSMLLKGGGARERLEMERLQNENKLLLAKIDALESAVRLEALMEDAVTAFKTYHGDNLKELDD